VEPAPDPDVATVVPPIRRKRRWPRILLAVLGVTALLLAAGATWWLQPQPLLPEARAALASTPSVSFSEAHGWLEFQPAEGSATTGVIIYPGGKVEPAAYARSAQAIAEAGFLVVIVPMPLNLAVLGVDRASEVMAAYPHITDWAIGGHSLGGAMAAEYVARRPGELDALFLWAAYPATDISTAVPLALSTYGTLDGGALSMTSDQVRGFLPGDTTWRPIEGGNHEQMGYYTGQPNDGVATISRAEQQAQVAAATVTMLEGLAPTAP
jgi:hypothetical protein